MAPWINLGHLNISCRQSTWINTGPLNLGGHHHRVIWIHIYPLSVGGLHMDPRIKGIGGHPHMATWINTEGHHMDPLMSTPHNTEVGSQKIRVEIL